MKVLHALALFLALFTSSLAVSHAWAIEPDEVMSNPVLEARARTLYRELRCMVCQNESIDESQAPLAHDLRVLIRHRLTEGQTNKQIVDFLVSRYGEFILLKPPLSWNTVMLWGAPPALLLLGGVMIFFIERRRRATGRPAADGGGLSAAEEARLANILGGEGAP